jgi:ubiquinone/menaquinone biosynthesis C-methylase UbiE
MTGGQDARFEGSVPVFYDRFLGGFYFEPFAADLARRLAVGDDGRVLELACGTGILTRRLRAAIPSGARLVATDLNQAMLDFARAKLSGADVHWRTADAQNLPFKGGVFDAVVCQFGVMFLPDKPAGFREARRVLRPGGAFLANVWCSLDDNPVAGAAQRAVQSLLPDDLPRCFETPYGFHDAREIERLAHEAGFTTVTIERVEIEGRAPSARHLATGIARGTPLAPALSERGVDPELVVEAITTALRDGDGALPFAAPLAALVITAT